MARYLVTGAAGFVGANLVARLKAQGHYVAGVDIKTTPHRMHLYEQADRFDLLDLRLPGSADQAVRMVGKDGRVFHLAADHGGMGYLTGAVDFKVAKNNIAIDRNILHASIQRGIERLFFASSACGYPTDVQEHDGLALSEGMWGAAPAQGLYGEAKRMSALMFEGARDTGFLDARSAIFHQLYGPTQDWEEPRAKFPPAVCRKFIEDPHRVELWGDGSQVRTFIFIEDALDRIQKMMELPYHGPTNLGSDEVVTVTQCAGFLADHLGVGTDFVYQPDMPTGVLHRTCDNTVWNERYGQTEFTSVREGFTRTYEWLAAHLSSAGHIVEQAA